MSVCLVSQSVDLDSKALSSPIFFSVCCLAVFFFVSHSLAGARAGYWLGRSLERLAAVLNVSPAVGVLGEVNLEHLTEGEVGHAADEAASATKSGNGEVVQVGGATWKKIEADRVY